MHQLTDARHSNQLIKDFIRFPEKYTDLLINGYTLAQTQSY